MRQKKKKKSELGNIFKKLQTDNQAAKQTYKTIINDNVDIYRYTQILLPAFEGFYIP